ncbi:serine hydrolase domain-containing protein [Jeotgalibacillus malaysiensis]|uniref:serine hydrolase domain-containing protein n=1 Tax=Jeotgalibacillus malaysiensis TaxID=1508404 RepID=UPI00384E8767
MSEQSELKKRIEDKYNELNFSGVVYAVEGESTLIQSAHGFADRSENRVNKIDTRFGIASGCKIFTAVAICQLVEKGVISFESRLADCLDIHFPHFDEEITVEHLLTHTSGVPDYFDEDVMDDFEELWIDRPVYRIDSLQAFLPIFQNEQMKFKPGRQFHYNNAGYILLGLIIEQQTDSIFTDYIESEIFKKAGMTASGYFELDRLPENTALGYIDHPEDQTWRTNIYSIPKKGGSDGGAFTTAADMTAFWNALLGFKLLHEETTKQLLTPAVHVNEELHYGYGIWLNQKDHHVYKYHVMGYDPGVSFRSAVYPDQNRMVTILSNHETEPYDILEVIEKG